MPGETAPGLKHVIGCYHLLLHRVRPGEPIRDDSKISSPIWRDSISAIEARTTSCRIPLPLGLSQRGDNWPATERTHDLVSQTFLPTRSAGRKESLGEDSVLLGSWPVVIPSEGKPGGNLRTPKLFLSGSQSVTTLQDLRSDLAFRFESSRWAPNRPW